MVKLIAAVVLAFFMGGMACGLVRDAEASRVIYVFVERHESSQILSPPDL